MNVHSFLCLFLDLCCKGLRVSLLSMTDSLSSPLLCFCYAGFCCDFEQGFGGLYKDSGALCLLSCLCLTLFFTGILGLYALHRLGMDA